MDFVKKQAALAWKFYREQLLKLHVGCMLAFLAVSALSAVVLRLFAEQAQAIVEGFMAEVQQSGLVDESGSISLMALFGNNLQATLTATVMGLMPFVYLPVFSLAVNGAVIGAVLALSEMMGMELWQMILLGLLPHGIFEIPAIMLGVAMGLYLCRQMNGTLRKRPGTPKIEAVLPHLCRVALFGVVPMLAVAALIETLVTPLLLGLAL